MPQIERANQSKLLSITFNKRKKTLKKHLTLPRVDLDASVEKVDATLVEDNDEEEGSDKDENVSESPSGPTIELKVALGKLDDNPAIALLADDEETEEKQNVNESMESRGAVSDMLVESSDEKSTKKRKVLIEELS